MDSLKLAIKASQPEVRNYVREVESKVARLQKQIAKLQADNLAYKHLVTALQKELDKLKKQEQQRVNVFINRDGKTIPAVTQRP